MMPPGTLDCYWKPRYTRPTASRSFRRAGPGGLDVESRSQSVDVDRLDVGNLLHHRKHLVVDDVGDLRLGKRVELIATSSSEALTALLEHLRGFKSAGM